MRPVTSPPVKAITVMSPYAEAIMAGIKPWETRPFPPNGDMRPEWEQGYPGLAVNAGERIYLHVGKARPAEGHYGPWRIEHLVDGRRKHTVCWDLSLHHDPYPDDGCKGHGPTDHLIKLRPGHIIGSFVVPEAIPICGETTGPGGRIIVAGAFGQPESLTFYTGSPGYGCEAIDDLYTLGNWFPGDWAWGITDVQPITECPLCGMKPGDALSQEQFEQADPDAVLTPCRVCGGDGADGPIQYRGRQGVWAL